MLKEKGLEDGTEPGPTNSNDGSEIKHTSPHRLMKNPLNNNCLTVADGRGDRSG